MDPALERPTDIEALAGPPAGGEGERAEVSGPAYVVNTPRLKLVPASPELATLFKGAVDASLDELRPWMTWAQMPVPLSVHYATLRGFRAKFEQDQDYIYHALECDGERFVGGGGLHRRVGPQALEIGYWIRTECTRRGLATEFAAALTCLAFRLHGVQRVEIRVAVGNTRSSAVPRKLGYRLDAVLPRRIELPGGGMADAECWSLFQRDFEESPAAKVAVEALDAMGRRMV